MILLLAMKENICSESGCRGYCCYNAELDVTKFERRRLFPEAKRRKTLIELREETEEGVYFSRLRSKRFGNIAGMEKLRIVGKCPNLDSSGICTQYLERSYAARNFIIGSKECNDCRNDYGLPPIKS